VPQRIMSELWDFIAQQLRDAVTTASVEELSFRLSNREYSVAEIAWKTLGVCYRWQAVLSGATTDEDIVEMDPAALDLVQAASDRYPPGRFPDSMSSDPVEIMERADDVFATIAAYLSELGPHERAALYPTWWGTSYTGDEIVARIMWTAGYADGQMRLLLEHTSANRKQ
jgi:hypothetical protein